MIYLGTPDYVLTGVTRLLAVALPVLDRSPGSISDVTLYSAYRAKLRHMQGDLRATARSTTLAEDLAALLSAYRRASNDAAGVLAGLERLIGVVRTFQLASGASGSAKRAADVEWALAGLLECLAVAEAAQAVASLTITSYETAVALRARFQRLASLAIDRAADRGMAVAVRALTTLSGWVARDLIERGRPLARIVTYETGVPLPAVVLAHRLYQDAGRSGELMAHNTAFDHPSFMPRLGRALSR